MNRAIIFILFSFLFVSCRNTQPCLVIDLEAVSVYRIEPVSQVMEEIQNPSAMHFFKKWIIFFNVESGADAPFYLYSTDSLKFQFHSGKFGRGPGEFFAFNPHYWEYTDSSFMINTNYFYRTELSVVPDELVIRRNTVISADVMNNLLRVNDTLVISDTRNQDKEYALYNVAKRKYFDSFSEFPKTKISYETSADRDNMLQKNCVINKNLQRMAAFYLRIPLVRLYDFDYNLLKEIRLKDIEESSIGLKDFYDDKENLYFLLPYATSQSIFVLFLNTTSDDSYSLKTTELQEWDWDGNLKNRFDIQEQVDLYCISEDGKTFYGLKTREENFRILKADLNKVRI